MTLNPLLHGQYDFLHQEYKRMALQAIATNKFVEFSINFNIIN